MKITELREWATAEFGAFSHKEGQVMAALGPLEEWLGHLARHGINFELVPSEVAAKLGASSLKPLHAVDEPPTPVNSGAAVEVPAGTIDVPVVVPDPSTFVTEPALAPEAPK
jgi:hypothetical protein